MFGVYTLRIVILMAVSLSIKQPSLSLLTHFLSLMADIRMTMPIYFLVPFTWNVFFYSFISKVVSIFDGELYFLEAEKNMIMISNQIASLSSYWRVEIIFRVIIERDVLVLVILLTSQYLLVCLLIN